MDEPPPTTSRRERLRLAAAEAAAFALWASAAVALGVFASRREVARELAQAWLAERGVEAAFEIQSLDTGAFVGSVQLGPARDPVFSAERVEVAYELTPPWSGEPFKLSTRAVRLVNPRLRIAYDGERFSFGALDPLIEDFLQRPDTGEPGPAVLIQGAQVTVVAPQGRVRASGDAAIADGELLRFDGRLLPTRLRGETFAAEITGGPVRLQKRGDGLVVDVQLAAADLTRGGLDLDGASLAIEGQAPYPDLKAKTLDGSVALRLTLGADKVTAGDAVVATPLADLRLLGEMEGSFANVALTGSLTGTTRAAALDAGAFEARDIVADLRVADLSGVRDESGFSLAGAARLDGQAAGGSAGPVDFADASLDLRAPSLVATMTNAGTSMAAPFSGRVGAARATFGELALTDASATGTGSFNLAEDFTFSAEADASAQGAMRNPQAAARRVPVLSGDAEQAAAMAAALRNFSVQAADLRVRDGRVTVAGPLRLQSASGGRAVLSPLGAPLLAQGEKLTGAFDLAVSGGGLPQLEAKVSSWALDDRGLTVRLAANGRFDAPPAEDATVDVDGTLRVRGGRTVFTLARCGTLTGERVEFGDNDVTGASARICPAASPLVTAGGGGWRLAGRFENAAGAVPALTFAASDAAGTFDVGGTGELARADVRVSAARVSDTERPARFNPVRTSGQATLARGAWRAVFPVTSGLGHPIALMTISHDVASGQGRADIDASTLVFSSEGLQPDEVSPLGELMRSAEGTAAFTGRILWGPDSASSSGQLSVPALNFRSPAGTVTGLSTTVTFTSLAPIVTAPDQQVTAERVNALVPLEQLSATFDMADEVIRIDAATAVAANGRVMLEPTTIPLAGDRTTRGVLVLDDVDIGSLVATTTLADRIKVDAVVDGRLPFEANETTMRFTEGHVTAVRPGRISINRTILTSVDTGAPEPSPMDVTPEAQEVNAIQDFAYQAMENLHFDTLEAGVNSVGPRLSLLFRIKGEHDPAVAEQARVGIDELLSGAAFQRRIPLPKGTPVNLTLDTSLNFDELLAAWRRQWTEAPEISTPRSDAVQP